MSYFKNQKSIISVQILPKNSVFSPSFRVDLLFGKVANRPTDKELPSLIFIESPHMDHFLFEIWVYLAFAAVQMASYNINS